MCKIQPVLKEPNSLEMERRQLYGHRCGVQTYEKHSGCSDGREDRAARGWERPESPRVSGRPWEEGVQRARLPCLPLFQASPPSAQGTCAGGAGRLPTLQTPGLLTPLPTAQPPPGLVSNQVIPRRSFTLFSVSERMRSC